MINHKLSLLLLTFVFLPMSLFAQSKQYKVTKQITISELNLDNSYDPYRNEVIRNGIDVIFESKKYHYLFSAKENVRQKIPLEKLNMDITPEKVTLSLAGKTVVREIKDYGNMLVELRLALYELFWGKAYVQKNKKALIARSQQKIKRIRKKLKNKNPITAKPVIKKAEAVKKPLKKKISKKKVSKKKANKSKSKVGKKKNAKGIKGAGPNGVKPITKPNESKNAKKDKSKTEKNKKTNGKNSSNGGGKDSIDGDITNKDKRSSKPNSSRNFIGKKIDKDPKDQGINSREKFGQRIIQLGLIGGYYNLSSQTTEFTIIDIKTNLAFFAAGGTFSSILKGKKDYSWWKNLDYHGLIKVGSAVKTDDFDVSAFKEIDIAAVSNEWEAVGLLARFALSQIYVVHLPELGKGLTMASGLTPFIGLGVYKSFLLLNKKVDIDLSFQFAPTSFIDIEDSQISGLRIESRVRANIWRNHDLQITYRSSQFAGVKADRAFSFGSVSTIFDYIYKF